MGKYNGAAFFDVDGTLIRKDSQTLEAGYILKQGIPSPGLLLGMAITYGAIQLARMGWISPARQNAVYLKTYRGRTRDDLARQAQIIFSKEIEAQFMDQAMALIDQHRRQGDMIVLVSATTDHLLKPLADKVGADKLFSTILEFDSKGNCTGRANGNICIQEEKQTIIQEFARDQDLDLSTCHAYSDHHADIPMLSAVGHPAVINPTAKLAAHARKKSWPVHLF